MAPFPFEEGLKDTVRSNPNQVTRIEIPFGQFPGRFVWHCHMLDHEDNEMMRTFFSTNPGGAGRRRDLPRWRRGR